jgi:hypothetical protein
MSRRALAVTGLTVCLGLAGAPEVAAQGTGTPLDLSGAIYSGTCDSLGESAVFQVGDFIPVNETEILGSKDIDFNLRAQQTLQADIEGLFNGTSPYAFVVRDNTDPQGDPVACGEIGGVQVNGLIVVGIDATDTTTTNGQQRIVGVAVFGSTEPTGPTTQPATTPGQLPVQAYLSEDALTQQPTPTATTTTQVVPTQAPPAASPTTQATATATMEPTMEPTTEPTVEPTEEPTTAPTEEPTTAPTLPPTEVPPTTAPPTEAPPPPTEVPPTTAPA